MRLIDADAVIAQYKGDVLTAQVDYAEGVRDVIEDIKNAPSIDIVRCKECIKRMREDCPMCNGCKLDRVPTEDNDFCSYGESEK